MLRFARTMTPTQKTAYGLLFSPVVANVKHRLGATTTVGATLIFDHGATDGDVDVVVTDSTANDQTFTAASSLVGGENFPLANVIDCASETISEIMRRSYFYAITLFPTVDDAFEDVLVAGYCHALVLSTGTPILEPELFPLTAQSHLVDFTTVGANADAKCVGILVEGVANDGEGNDETSFICFDGINGFARQNTES